MYLKAITECLHSGTDEVIRQTVLQLIMISTEPLMLGSWQKWRARTHEVHPGPHISQSQQRLST